MTSVIGQSVVITGGTSGIGRACAMALANQGAEVYATGLFDEELERVANDPEMAGITALKLDVSDGEAVGNFFATLPRLDCLINCAGTGRGDNEFTEQGFLHTLDINLNGTMRCCYAARALLGQKGGCIVNIASVMSFFGSATGPAYSTSKGAIVQFTQSLAVAWAEHNIRVNAVAPGWIETPMTVAMQDDTERNRKVIERTPMGRWGRAEEIAEAVGFLASPRASFITGAVLPVDGGYIAKGI